MSDATELSALLRLMAWLSPAFPIGSFAYSGGLERAVHDGLVMDASDLQAWLSAVVDHGALWNDCVLLGEAHRAARDALGLAACAELAEALAGSRERHQETMLLGEAFLTAASAWPEVTAAISTAVAYPVAVGATASVHGIGCEQAVAAYLHAFVSQGVSAAIRLGICGQKDGVAVIAVMEGLVAATAERAACSTLDDLGSAAIQADIVSLRHETQRVRLFRS